MACTCTKCPDCNGTGNIWVSFSGKYLGTNRCDDLDEMESCPTCGGEGITDYCQECCDAYREMEEEEEERAREDFIRRQYWDNA